MSEYDQSDFEPADPVVDWAEQMYAQYGDAAPAVAATMGSQQAASQLQQALAAQLQAEAGDRAKRNALDVERSLAAHYGQRFTDLSEGLAEYLEANDHLVPEHVTADPHELLKHVETAFLNYEVEAKKQHDADSWKRVREANTSSPWTR